MAAQERCKSGQDTTVLQFSEIYGAVAAGVQSFEGLLQRVGHVRIGLQFEGHREHRLPLDLVNLLEAKQAGSK